jgi:hypothetical protein
VSSDFKSDLSLYLHRSSSGTGQIPGLFARQREMTMDAFLCKR